MARWEWAGKLGWDGADGWMGWDGIGELIKHSCCRRGRCMAYARGVRAANSRLGDLTSWARGVGGTEQAGALVDGSVSGIASMAGRSMSMHGLYVWWGCCSRVFVLLAARSGVGRIRLCTDKSTQSRRVARGSSTNMVGVSLCLSPQGPKMAIEMGGAACPLVQDPGGPPHLTSTRRPLLFADWLTD